MPGTTSTCSTPISEMPSLLSEDMVKIPLEENLDSSENSNKSDLLYCVRWAPPIVQCFDFFEKYRFAIQQPLGGTRKSSYQYAHNTIQTAMSVGSNDSRSCLPQRITLSNFKLESPITSYGCINRYFNPEKQEAEYLIIRRTYSLSYADLIRGNYQESHLFFMIQYLTSVERSLLISQPFDFLWKDFHGKPAEGESYEYGLKIFSRLQKILPQLFQDFPSRDPYGKYLWLFPKGKPDYYVSTENKDGSDTETSPYLTSESPIQSALREYQEETNGCILDLENLVLKHPIIERHLGSNCKNYQTNYFVFQSPIRSEIRQFSKQQPELSPMISNLDKSEESRVIDKPREPGVTDKPGEPGVTDERKNNKGYEEIEMIKWIPYSEIENYLCAARCHLLQYIEKQLPSDPPRVEIHPGWKRPAKAHELVFG